MKEQRAAGRNMKVVFFLLLLTLCVGRRAFPQQYELPLARNDSARWHRNDSLAKIYERQGMLREASQMLDDNGMLFWERNRQADAIKYFERSLKINEQLGNHNGIARINSNLGFLYADLEEYEKAFEFLEKTLVVRRAENKKVGIISALINEAVVLDKLKRYGESVVKLEEALSLAQQMNDETQMRSVYGMLSETYQKAGDAEKALYYYNYYRTFNDYVTGEAIRQAKSEVEQHKLQEENLALQNRNNELELERQRWQLSTQASSIVELSDAKRKLLDSLGTAEVLNSMLSAENDKERLEGESLKREAQRMTMLVWVVVLGIAIVVFALVFTLVLLRNRTRYNRLLTKKNETITEQSEELRTMNESLHTTNRELAQRNDLILSSIRASRDVQDAIFSYSSPIEELFADSFHISHARDIVSGDFCYARQASDGTRILVVGDCTGHGVSAAFLTILAIATLDRVLFDKWVRTPSDALMALDKVFSGLNEGLLVTLHSMDVAMICIAPSEEYLEFAGAKNGVMVVSPEGAKYYRGSRFVIGESSVKMGRNVKPVETVRVPITGATWCYMYSDGFVDQFNEHSQKYSTPRLHALLGSLYGKPAETQCRLVDEAIASWRGNEDQMDDQILVGVKVGGEE